jgi:hypothetical protein
VSKWRNNQRKIPTKNGTARKLSEFILAKEEERNSQVIFHILKTLKEDISPESTGQQIDALSRWLTEKDIEPIDKEKLRLSVFAPKHGYNTNASIFLDEDGIDEAIAYFFEYILRLSPGKTIYLIDNSGINWTKGDELTEKQVRIDNYIKHCRTALEYGHRLVIVDCNVDLYRPHRAVFRWNELYSLDGVEVRNYPPIQSESCRSTTFSIENEVILQCLAGSESGGKPHGMLYTNRETVNYFASIVSGMYKKSMRFIESVPLKDVLEFAEIICNSIRSNRSVYMLNPSITLQMIDDELLAGILTANNISESKIEECIAAANKIRRAQALYQCTYICNLDVLERFAASESVADSMLSALCEARIVLSKEHLRKILRAVMDSAIYKKGGVIFTSFEHMGSLPQGSSIFVQEDGVVATWNAQKYKKRLFCANLDVVFGFYRYVDDLKTTIPKICQDREWRDKQITRILENI